MKRPTTGLCPALKMKFWVENLPSTSTQAYVNLNLTNLFKEGDTTKLIQQNFDHAEILPAQVYHKLSVSIKLVGYFQLLAYFQRAFQNFKHSQMKLGNTPGCVCVSGNLNILMHRFNSGWKYVYMLALRLGKKKLVSNKLTIYFKTL